MLHGCDRASCLPMRGGEVQHRSTWSSTGRRWREEILSRPPALPWQVQKALRGPFPSCSSSLSCFFAMAKAETGQCLARDWGSLWGW